MQIDEIECAVGKQDAGRWSQTGTRKTLALCDDVWAICPDEAADWEDQGEQLFKLIHRPTGYAALSRKDWDTVLETLREIRTRQIDWAWTDPTRAKKLSDEWASIKAAVARRLSVDVQSPLESAMAADAVDPHVGGGN